MFNERIDNKLTKGDKKVPNMQKRTKNVRKHHICNKKNTKNVKK